MFGRMAQDHLPCDRRGERPAQARACRSMLLSTVLLACLGLSGLSGCNDVSSAPEQAPPQDTTPGPPGPLAISTSSLPAGIVGRAYAATLAGAGGTPPYTWLVTPPLPSALALDPRSGAITGTPSAGTIGTTSHSFVLQDATFQSVTRVVALTINAAPLGITTTSLPIGTVNQIYPATTLLATGGIPPYVWSVNPPLPNGLAFNILSPGTISGVPLAGSEGTRNFVFGVTDSAAPIHQTASTTLPLTINLTVTPVTITTGSLPIGKVGQAYSSTLQGSGGTLPYSWSVAPAMPPGLTLNASTGAIGGIPTVASNFSLSFTIRDSTTPLNQSSTRSLTLQVAN